MQKRSSSDVCATLETGSYVLCCGRYDFFIRLNYCSMHLDLIRRMNREKVESIQSTKNATDKAKLFITRILKNILKNLRLVSWPLETTKYGFWNVATNVTYYRMLSLEFVPCLKKDNGLICSTFNLLQFLDLKWIYELGWWKWKVLSWIKGGAICLFKFKTFLLQLFRKNRKKNPLSTTLNHYFIE